MGSSTELENTTTSSISLDPDLDNLSEVPITAATTLLDGWEFEFEEDRPDNRPSTSGVQVTETMDSQFAQANVQQPLENSTPEREDNQPSDTEPHQRSTQVEQTELEQALQPAAAKARERSQRKYNRQHVVERFIAGDIVTLKIPREDRAATNPTRITCRVLAESYPNRYKLQTKYGVLSNHYPVTQLLRVPDSASAQIAIPSTPMSTVISLHAAAGKNSTSERIGISCNCKGPQCKGRCRCMKNKVKCSVHCYATEHDCGNLSELAIRTELALVNRPTSTGASISTSENLG